MASNNANKLVNNLFATDMYKYIHENVNAKLCISELIYEQEYNPQYIFFALYEIAEKI